MARRDLSPELQRLYFPKGRTPELLEVPSMQFAAIDGVGDPSTSSSFHGAIEALYGVAYTIRFAAKKAGLPDVPVMPLEGLFWTDDGEPFPPADRSRWRWSLLLMEAGTVTRPFFDRCVRDLRSRKRPIALESIRFWRWKEGTAAQIVHVGPYSEEGPTIERLHDFVRKQGLRPCGRHHEIYLGDPRRSAPARLRTVLRQPACR